MSKFEDLVIGIRKTMQEYGEVDLKDFSKRHGCNIEDAIDATHEYRFRYDLDTVMVCADGRISLVSTEL